MIDVIAWGILILVGGFFATIAVIGLCMIALAVFGAPLAVLIRIIRG